MFINYQQNKQVNWR